MIYDFMIRNVLCSVQIMCLWLYYHSKKNPIGIIPQQTHLRSSCHTKLNVVMQYINKFSIFTQTLGKCISHVFQLRRWISAKKLANLLSVDNIAKEHREYRLSGLYLYTHYSAWVTGWKKKKKTAQATTKIGQPWMRPVCFVFITY